MTYRGPRRSSIFAGLLLVLVGALFLIHNLQPGLLQLSQLARYWPVLLILWGLAILWDRMTATRAGQPAPRAVSGSDLLLVLLVLAGVVAILSYDHLRRNNGGWDGGIGLFDNSYTFTGTPASQAVTPGSFVDLSTPRGDISVHAQPQHQLNVVVTKTVSAASQDAAQKLADETSVSVVKGAQGWQVAPKLPSDRVRVGYDVSLFPQTSVTASTGHGNIHVTGIGGDITTSASGNVEISGSGGNTSIDLRHGDVHVHSADGNVTVNGRGEQIDLGEIKGSVSINGEFYGPIRVRRVAKTVQFNSRRTSLSATELPGGLEMDSGQLVLSDTAGNVTLDTRDKDITLENVQGKIHVTDRNGNIELRFTQPPGQDIDVTNRSGDINLVLPERSSFTLNAVARSGDISSEFQQPGLKLVEASSSSTLNGAVGSGGPQITLNTSYGTIHIRRAPNPPSVPSPPEPPGPPSTRKRP